MAYRGSVLLIIPAGRREARRYAERLVNHHYRRSEQYSGAFGKSGKAVSLQKSVQQLFFKHIITLCADSTYNFVFIIPPDYCKIKHFAYNNKCKKKKETGTVKTNRADNTKEDDTDV